MVRRDRNSLPKPHGTFFWVRLSFHFNKFTWSYLQSDCPFFWESGSPLEIFRDRAKFMIIRPESVFRTARDDSFSAEF